LEAFAPCESGTFSARLPKDVRQQVDKVAHATKRSRSSIVNEAVTVFMRERAQYLGDLDRAVESGLGYSGERIFAWMRSWGTEDELPALEPDIRPGESATRASYSRRRPKRTFGNCALISSR
jgi:predicted transcriptional regulator